jgi:hypothetical protein
MPASTITSISADLPASSALDPPTCPPAFPQIPPLWNRTRSIGAALDRRVEQSLS